MRHAKWFLALAVIVTLSAIVSAQIVTLDGDPSTTWVISGRDPTVTSTAGLVEANSYAQLASADTIYVKSGSAADTTMVVRIVGIGADSVRKIDRIELNGATNVAGDIKFLYFENAWIDSGGACAGIVTISDKSDSTTIATIAAGDLATEIAHRYFGEAGAGKIPDKPYVKALNARVQGAGTTVNSMVDRPVIEVRYYPIWSATNYVLLMAAAGDSTKGQDNLIVDLPDYVGYHGNKLVQYSRIAVFASSASDTVAVTALVNGANR